MRDVSIMFFSTFFTLVSSSSLAQSFRLEYQRDGFSAHCPTEEEFRTSLAAKLGKEAFSPDGAKTVRVAIRRMNAQVMAGTLKLLNEKGKEEGRRELTSSQTTCDELSESLLLAAALVVDPLFLSRKPPAPIYPQPNSVEPPTEAPLPPEKTPDPWQVDARIWLGGGWSTAPVFVPQGSIGLMAHRERLGLGIEGRTQLPATYTRGTATLTSSAWSVAFLPCYRQTLSFCGVAALGSATHESTNVVNAQTANTLWSHIGVRLEGGFPFGPGQVMAIGELSKPLTVTRLRLEPLEIWKTPDWIASIGLGYALKL